MWADVDNAWEQKKPEARKMLENAADSHTSGARFVSPLFDGGDCDMEIVIVIIVTVAAQKGEYCQRIKLCHLT